MTPRRLIAAAALLLTLAAGRAAACSVTRDYVRPTNFELVAMADAIVVARTEGSATKPTEEHMPEGVSFRTTATLKGQAPQTLATAFATIGRPEASDPTDLTAANPEAYAGPCNRMTYAKGASYVLFLARDGAGGMRVIGIPFSRVSEDYLGEDSLWVRTIRLYLDIQREPDPMVQLTRLETLRGQLLARGDAASKAQAADILDHLTSRSPWKPTAYLIQTWEALARGETPRYPIRGPEANREFGAAQAMTDLITGREGGPFGRAAQMDAIVDALVLGQHPDAGPFFERLLASPDATAGQVGAAIRWYAGNGRLRLAYELTRDRATGLLVGLEPETASELFADIASAMGGEAWQDGTETWRTDPVVAAGWPRLAMRLDRHQRLLLGRDGAIGFSGVLDTLRPADYRRDPEVALALSAGHDEAVQAWARQQLKAPPHKPAEMEDEVDNPDRLPIRLMVVAFGEERDAELVRLFCQGGERRTLVLHLIGVDGDSLDMDLVDRFAAFKALSDDDRDVLVRSLAMVYAREQGPDPQGMAYYRHDDILERIGKIQNKAPIKASPAACAG